MVKKTFILLLTLTLLLPLFGCAPTQSQPAGASSPSAGTSAPTTLPTALPTTLPTTQPTTAPTTLLTTAPTLPTTAPTQPPVDTDSLWVPICQEYINLRATPGGTLIGTVQANETVTIKGWYGKYALVACGDKQGYVLSSYLKPAATDYLTKRLKVVTLTDTYSYEQMLQDLSALQVRYPSTVRVASIGNSELGRRIPVLQLGNANAKYHVLLQGAMHAREHFTACLLMAMTDRALSQGIPSDVCYHIIPMSNPDGVVISQTGVLDSTQNAIYQQDLTAGYTTYNPITYAQQWKANALGVDLNRNFASGWAASLERPNPSCQKYRGSEAFCAAESRALRDYTLQYNFAATLSFHSSGSVIYYQYGNRQPVNRLSYSLALAAEAVTGYTPLSSDGTSGAGYKDWAMDALGIPSLTLEIGCYDSPVLQQEIYNTFARFEDFLPAINTWLRQNA